MRLPGAVDSHNRFWMRCPECGEPNWKEGKSVHAFFSLKTLSGHCYRCGATLELNQLDVEGLAELFRKKRRPVVEETKKELYDWWKNLPEVETERPTFLPVKKFSEFFVFPMQDPATLEVTGVHLRHSKRKLFYSLGSRGLGIPLEISILQPWRVVEGPYDVLDSQTVAVFGSPDTGRLQKIPAVTVILCPDGDVWDSATLRSQWVRIAKHMYSSGKQVFFEVLPENKDPDEVPVEQRELIHFKRGESRWNMS